ncbi:hypothetical protein LTR08_006811 [Meristemomyces frigidus]|nr:hypothetical protein LTR08_006811 [Meristemomyces frigidus]
MSVANTNDERMLADNSHPGDKTALSRHAPLHLVSNTPKGRGIFAGQDIPARTVIDTCPVLVLDPQENVAHIEKTSLYHYTYNWPLPGGKAGKTQAVVFGLGSMFNHSTQDQNVGWTRDLEHQLIVYRALRPIAEGEELCISYGDHLTFVDADAPSSSELPIEQPEDVFAGLEVEMG